MDILKFIVENKEWLFSGVAVTIIGYFLNLLNRNKNNLESERGPNVHITNNLSTGGITSSPTIQDQSQTIRSLQQFKDETRILFIDDDTTFKVAKILVNTGWIHTKLIKDAKTLDENEIVQADILFVDVQGVGQKLGFQDEGLGLALAIKEKYPSKKVVIYSAETQGNRFHNALRKADSFLPKNADPYEFQKLVEEFTLGVEE